MATRTGNLLFIVLLTAACSALALTRKPQRPRRPPLASFPGKPVTFDETALRLAIRDSAFRFVGLLEKPGRADNRGAWLDELNAGTGFPIGSRYCAIGLYRAHLASGVQLIVSAPGRVNAWFQDPDKIIYRRNPQLRYSREPQRMDWVSLYESHVEAYDEPSGWLARGIDDDRVIDKQAAEDERRETRVWLIGFNTSGGRGTREGVYRNKRKVKDIKKIANHLTPYLKAWPKSR